MKVVEFNDESINNNILDIRLSFRMFKINQIIKDVKDDIFDLMRHQSLNETKIISNSI